MPDDPIFSADEMTYDYSDSDIECVNCGNPNPFWDERREEYICAACLKREDQRHMRDIAAREAEMADSIERDIERYERQRKLRT